MMHVPNGADEAIRSLGQLCARLDSRCSKDEGTTPDEKNGRNPADTLGSSPIFTSEKYRP
jgi:hypothetical protein